MARLLDLLYRGRSIAKREGAYANIEWSHRNQVLKLTNIEAFSIAHFRAIVIAAIRDCQDTLQPLMFNWEPAIDLDSIKDNLTNNQAGWSFLMEPGNDLQGSFRHLHQRAWEQLHLRSRREGGIQWSSQHAEGYIQLATKFQHQLLTYIHFTGGLPGRSIEITTIKWCNTHYIIRNIFVYHSRLIVITEYTKARYKTNQSFYIIRFLLLSISRILFQYLVYIRPFIGALEDQAGLAPKEATSLDKRSFALSSLDRTPLTTMQLSAAIAQQSRAGLGACLTVALYRQSAVAIVKQHLPGLARPFDPYAVRCGDNTLQAIARQSGHTIETLIASYAINQAYPTRLQPELLVQYEMISGLWHRWLQLGEIEAAEADIGMKEGREGKTVKAYKAGERARAPLRAQQLP